MNTIIYCCSLLILGLWLPHINSQGDKELSIWRNITTEEKAYNQFALELFMEMSCLLDSQHNMMLSPLSVWSVLALLTEGAAENTQAQLSSALHLDMGKKTLRDRYLSLDRSLKASKNSTVVLNSANALVTDENRPINSKYESIVERVYNARIIPVNFHKVKKAAQEINSWIANITNDRITRIVNEGDLQDPHLILANAVYFKGTWKHPFNESNTVDEDFLDEAGNVTAKVPTMRQLARFVYGYIPEVEGHLLVLPYLGDEYSMVVAMPQRKVPLLHMVERMKLVSLSQVLTQLWQLQGGSEYEVQVYLPRFVIRSDFILNSPLANLGIKDAFTDRANFRLISSQDIYVSRLIHKAEIEVNEKGTVASAATGATFADKMMPPVFRVNRPFVYFIIENTHKTILFTGRVNKPSVR